MRNLQKLAQSILTCLQVYKFQRYVQVLRLSAEPSSGQSQKSRYQFITKRPIPKPQQRLQQGHKQTGIS
jgi:hypothetical protein